MAGLGLGEAGATLKPASSAAEDEQNRQRRHTEEATDPSGRPVAGTKFNNSPEDGRINEYRTTDTHRRLFQAHNTGKTDEFKGLFAEEAVVRGEEHDIVATRQGMADAAVGKYQPRGGDQSALGWRANSCFGRSQWVPSSGALCSSATSSRSADDTDLGLNDRHMSSGHGERGRVADTVRDVGQTQQDGRSRPEERPDTNSDSQTGQQSPSRRA